MKKSIMDNPCLAGAIRALKISFASTFNVVLGQSASHSDRAERSLGYRIQAVESVHWPVSPLWTFGRTGRAVSVVEEF
jgi:hypothetical protein